MDQATLLLVEDTEIDRRLARRELTRELPFCRLLEAACVEEAKDILGTEKIDCAIVDYHLPDGTVRDVIEHVSTLSTQPAVVVLTAVSDESVAAELLAMGAQDFVVKGGGRGISQAVKYATVRTRVTELEQRLHVSERLAAVGQLAAGVAHEINNPLNFLLANLHELRNLAKGNPQADEFAELLNSTEVGIKRISRVVRELSTFSREEGKESQLVDINGVLTEALEMSRNELRHRAHVDLDLGQLPKVFGQPGQLVQLILNLLMDAAHKIEPGRADENRIRITTGLRSGQIFVDVELQEASIGPANDTKGAFANFFSRKGSQSSKLGLRVSREIAEEHGGSLSLRPHSEGAIARLVLPIGEQGSRPESPAPPQVELPLERKRVLVVDDDDEVRRGLARILKRHHDVEEANGGHRVLELLSEGTNFDVILCDLMMPQINGAELHDRVRNNYPIHADRFIFISGGTLDVATHTKIEKTGLPYLRKPVGPAHLIDAVTLFCDDSRESA